MNKIRKHVWFYFKVIVIIFLMIHIIMMIGYFLKQVIPIERTHFSSYRMFVKSSEFARYPTELPKSACDIQYYYYEGGFSDVNGYHATLSDKDYEGMKQERLYYYKDCTSRGYNYDGNTKRYLDKEQIKELKVDYLDKITKEGMIDSRFYFLAYDFPLISNDIYHYVAVLCNDETKEIIEISCRRFQCGMTWDKVQTLLLSSHS